MSQNLRFAAAGDEMGRAERKKKAAKLAAFKYWEKTPGGIARSKNSKPLSGSMVLSYFAPFGDCTAGPDLLPGRPGTLLRS